MAMNVQAGAVLVMPLGMFCFAQKVLECYRRALIFDIERTNNYSL